jgi:hypothetical protein
MHVEHIIPSGGNAPDNLCLSCSACNLSKARATAATDPLTGDIVPLFNPRIQVWDEHFQWVENGEKIAGLTPIGRATIIRLKMNIARVVEAQRVWIQAGVHPPK